MIRNHKVCCAAHDCSERFEKLENLLKIKVLPSLNDLSDIAKNTVSSEMGKTYSYDSATSDPYYDARRDYEADVYLEMEEMSLLSIRQTIVSSFVISINSFIEQSLIYVLSILMGIKVQDISGGLHYWNNLVKKLYSLGVDIKDFEGYEQVIKIRNVANSLKHGFGKSSAVTEDLHPEVLGQPTDPRWNNGGDILGFTPSIEFPFLQDEIAISNNELVNLLSACKTFLQGIRNGNCNDNYCFHTLTESEKYEF
jgi:hypothetical protein